MFEGLWWIQSSYPHSNIRLLYPECFPNIRLLYPECFPTIALWAIQRSLSTNAFLFPRNWCSSAKWGQLSKLQSLNKNSGNSIVCYCSAVRSKVSYPSDVIPLILLVKLECSLFEPSTILKDDYMLCPAYWDHWLLGHCKWFNGFNSTTWRTETNVSVSPCILPSTRD